MKKRWFVGLGVILVLIFLVGGVLSDKLEIKFMDSKENYVPGENINFKIIVYDDNRIQLNEKVNFEIQNYYKDVVREGEISSGEEVSFQIPENAIRGYWGVIAKYKDITFPQLFNVIELERAEIRLEGDNLIVENVGNVVYGKPIQIAIGEHKETALVPLDVGQIKKIRLTAPSGEYDVSVSDGTEENTFEVKGVSLTGNVIGLEKIIEGSFWKRYPLIGLFLFALLLVVVVILGSKVYRKFSK